jgi:hypothetical protein
MLESRKIENIGWILFCANMRQRLIRYTVAGDINSMDMSVLKLS